MENWTIKECPCGVQPFGNHSGNLRGIIKGGQVDTHQKSPLPESEGDWNHQMDLLVHSLEVATCVNEMSGHGGTVAMQR